MRSVREATSAFQEDSNGWLDLVLALVAENQSLGTRLTDLQKRFEGEVHYLRDEIKNERSLRTLTGDSQPMRAVRLAIQQVAQTDSTVLILGETGTGKELVARGIHQLSRRRDHLLVTVNCAALNANIVTSELFGHEAGAFTGATRRRVGRFELADGGTIFLDEIAELPAETQVLLLRVLQERTIERVGGNEAIAVDVRVIAATHQDLSEAVAEGRFRADLFYRLNVFPIPVPPLRDRREDIVGLIKHFVDHFNRQMLKGIQHIDPATLRLLMHYDWPGNVRELENLVERAMIVAGGTTLAIDPSWLSPCTRPQPASDVSSLQALEKGTILKALERCNGKIYGDTGAARALGLKPTTLYGKMRKHGISRRKGAEARDVE
jgi:formate hydrogenlyase transcriptional activator